MSDDELPDVLFLDDLARLLRCSRRSLDRKRAARANLPPQMPSIDDRPRWAKARVLEWMAQSDAAARFKVAMGGRR